MKYPILTLLFLISTTSGVFAHWGHLGDVAGHAHWLGVGAVIVAGVIGCAVGKGARKTDDESESDVPLEQEDGETA